MDTFIVRRAVYVAETHEIEAESKEAAYKLLKESMFRNPKKVEIVDSYIIDGTKKTERKE